MLKRKKQFRVRFTEQEYADLRRKAKLTGHSTERFIRCLIAGCELKPRPPDCYKDLVREFAAIGNNINQITHLANSTGYVSRAQIEQLTDLMKQIWQLAHELGR